MSKAKILSKEQGKGKDGQHSYINKFAPSKIPVYHLSHHSVNTGKYSSVRIMKSCASTKQEIHFHGHWKSSRLLYLGSKT